ncbi:hypothetical protein C0J50_23990, partial [Silurus asotus]
VGLRVEGGLSEQSGVLLRSHTELIVEESIKGFYLITHLLHIVPVGNDAMLDGVLEGQDTPLALGLITNVAVLLTHTNHHTL